MIVTRTGREQASRALLLGQELVVRAGAAAAQGDRPTAAALYLCAADHLAASEAGDGRAAFQAHRAAWEGFVSQTSWAVERLDIPYAHASLPGWLFRPGDALHPRPVLVLDDDVDVPISERWRCAPVALEGGIGVLLFDGPRQHSAALTHVVRYLATRADVHEIRIALNDHRRDELSQR